MSEAVRFAQAMAVTERARGRADEERNWLDILVLLSQHDAELRAQIAREIRAEIEQVALTTVLSYTQVLDLMDFAAKIAEGESND